MSNPKKKNKSKIVYAFIIPKPAAEDLLNKVNSYGYEFVSAEGAIGFCIKLALMELFNTHNININDPMYLKGLVDG
jgi:hypothetical protein